MRATARASLGLVALTLCICSAAANPVVQTDPNPSWRNSVSISELTEILEVWLDHHSGFERHDTTAEVRVIKLATSAYPEGNAGRSHGSTRGLYDPETSIIYLIPPWNPKNAKDVSILLHELVHHRQTPHYFYCPGAQEEAAYQLQADWLKERGLQANVNRIAVVLESGCAARDIHPD